MTAGDIKEQACSSLIKTHQESCTIYYPVSPLSPQKDLMYVKQRGQISFRFCPFLDSNEADVIGHLSSQCG